MRSEYEISGSGCGTIEERIKISEYLMNMKNYQGEEWRTMTAEEIFEVVGAFLRGSKIEVRSYPSFISFRDLDKQWTEVEFPSWSFTDCQYRVKTESDALHLDTVASTTAMSNL